METRPLSYDEMDAAAVVHRTAFNQRLPWLAGLHTPEQDRTYFREYVFNQCQVWGAFDEAELVAMTAFREGWIDHLYVLPAHQSRGIGAALLAVAKGLQPGLRLWTFQRNEAARRFYERHGFTAIQETDGSRNEEREPDVLYEWRLASKP